MFLTPPLTSPYPLDLSPSHPRELALPHGAPQGPVPLPRRARQPQCAHGPVKQPSQISDRPVKWPSQIGRAALHPPSGAAAAAARLFHPAGNSQVTHLEPN